MTIINLSSSDNTTVTLTINSSALFDNTAGFYEIDADGSVIDPLTGQSITPGEEGYAEAALANRLDLSLSSPDRTPIEVNTEFEGGKIYAPFIVANGTIEDLLDEPTEGDPSIYFSFTDANVDGVEHVRNLGDNTLGFEDLPGGGDEDFNDITIAFSGLDLAPEGTGPGSDSEPEPDLEGNGKISGIKFNDLNGNGVRDTELVQGENPDVVYVIDVSGSADFDFEGSPLGDINGDGLSDTRLDAEIAGFTGLNQQLIDQGFGDNVDIGLVVFSGNAAQVDLDLATDGTQLTTTANADSDGNGTSDIEEILLSIESGAFGVGNFTGTNFEVALQTAEDTFSSIGTEANNGNLIFLSDGEVNGGGSYDDEVERLSNLGVSNISAFGVGEDADIDNLQVIDPDARIFTSTDEILNVFADLDSNNNGGEDDESQSTLEPTLSDTTIYLDLNDNGVFDEGEPSQVTDANGQYVFDSLQPGTYTVREVVPDGFTQTAPTDDGFTVTLDEDEIVEDLDFGNVADTSESGPETEPDGIIRGDNLVIDNNGVIGSVDLATGEFTEIFDTDILLTDIDIAPDNKVFAISFADLYEIDLETQSATQIGSHGIGGLNALEIAEDGTLYATSNSRQEVFTLDPLTGAGTSIGSIPFSFSSAGDLQFINNTLFATGTQDLVAFNVDGGTLNNSTAVGSFDIGNIFGITIDEDGDPVGLTGDGGIVGLDISTGTQTSVGTVENNRGIFGAAALPEGFLNELESIEPGLGPG